MSVTAGEFFVNLGVKGSEKTIGAITETTKGMGGLASMSLEAKAAIVGAVYALERLMADSASYGAHLTNISTLLGGNGIARALQQYEWAAKQVGVATGNVDNSFQGLAATLEDIKFGKGPEFASLVLGATHADPERFRNDIQYAMKKLQEFALSTNFTAQDKLKFLKSFGLDPEFISAMMQNAFRPDQLARAIPYIYSDDQLKALQQTQAAWSNLWADIEKRFGLFTSKHGKELIRDVREIVDAFGQLGSTLEKVAEEYKVFDLLAKSVKILSDALKDLTDYHEGKRTFFGDIIDQKTGKVKTGLPILEGGFWNLLGALTFGTATRSAKDNYQPSSDDIVKSILNRSFSSPQSQAPVVNQTLQFQHDGRDHQKVQDSHKKAIKDAYNAIPSIVRGS